MKELIYFKHIAYLIYIGYSYKAKINNIIRETKTKNQGGVKMKRTDRLKFPQIASLLYNKQLDLEEWIPQIKQGIGLGIWTFSKIEEDVTSDLEEFNSLLAKVNGAKLNQDEEEEYKQYRKFAIKMSVILRNAKKGVI